MKLTAQEHTLRVLIVPLPERIDAFNAAELRSQVDELIQTGNIRLIFDLSETPFLDSAGLAVLVSAFKHARQAGGNVKLVWPRAETAQRILRLTRFDKVFEMLDTSEQGLPVF